jgi:hypothetical protein
MYVNFELGEWCEKMIWNFKAVANLNFNLLSDFLSHKFH